MAKYTKAERDEAIIALRELLAPGDTVYTVVTHVARSGMSRHIRCYCVIMQNGKPVVHWISNLVARALGYSQDYRSGALKVSGCGMDMCFHVVHSLSYALHGHAGERSGYSLRKEDL
jgi:hypothetical protein